MVTTGGDIWGYWASGNVGMTTRPPIRMIKEQTVARTGLVRKTFVTLAVPTERG
jgi:hypothetical protein